jgi:hypothetical protein
MMLDGGDRRSLHEAVDGRDDDEVLAVAAAGPGGLAAVLDATFEGMVSAFSGKGPRTPATLQYAIATPDGVRTYHVNVVRDGCELVVGPAEHARVTMSLGVVDWLRLAAGTLDIGRALRAGTVKLEGDVLYARKMGRWFARS